MASAPREWYADTRSAMAEDPKRGALLGLYYVYVGLWLTLSTRVRLGTHVYDRDWDLLVVLDACRVDALRAAADEYGFLEEVGAVWSVGSTSGEWVARTFDADYADEIARTAYVTANPHSQEVLGDRVLPPQYVAAPLTLPSWDPVRPTAFHSLDEVWRYGKDERLGAVPPRVTTDRAIRAGRDGNADRLMVHYMQPHAPYIAGHLEEDTLPQRLRYPFDSLRGGTLDREKAWGAYVDNLRLVLEEVELLLDSVEADRVVLTADHGEAFGERGFYEHPVGCPLPVVRKVPWVEATAVDSGAYQPGVDAPEGGGDVEVEEFLADLGYL